MSDVIHLLPDSVANQIAAGEVIQRPASVLKELVENAIDAGATHIQIVIKDAGRTLIQVIDNGKGMSQTDARMAFERHATSKISDAKDLFSLRTMGFRGEALASIAAVAQVEMCTRRHEDELGTQIEVADSEVISQEEIQTPAGTNIKVKNLFFNVPVRRRFLKSDNVEKTHLLNEFYRIALINSNISFSFIDNVDEVFQIQSSNTKLRIENIFGKTSKKRWEQQLLPIETSTNLVKIYGYIGKPEFAQKLANQYFFVNGRYMRHPYFHKAVMMAYDKMLNQGENPNYFIYFEIDPQSIDVNIHPTKTEIKFENEQAIFPILSATVRETLGKFNIVPSIDFNIEGMPDIPVITNKENIEPPRTNFNPNYNPFSSSGSYKRSSLDWEKLYQDFDKSAPRDNNKGLGFDEIILASDSDSIQQKLYSEEEHMKRENLQLKNKYILTSVKSGLMIIDQQQAHFRILYDMFLKQLENKGGVSQQLLFPETLELNENEKIVFEQILPDLKKVGFDISKEDGVYLISGIPSIIEISNICNIIFDILEKSEAEVDNPTFTMKDLIASSLADNSCMKTGQSLSDIEMIDLIEKLFASSNHNYTSKGKKILSIITYEDLENLFR